MKKTGLLCSLFIASLGGSHAALVLSSDRADVHASYEGVVASGNQGSNRTTSGTGSSLVTREVFINSFSRATATAETNGTALRAATYSGGFDSFGDPSPPDFTVSAFASSTIIQNYTVLGTGPVNLDFLVDIDGSLATAMNFEAGMGATIATVSYGVRLHTVGGSPMELFRYDATLDGSTGLTTMAIAPDAMAWNAAWASEPLSLIAPSGFDTQMAVDYQTTHDDLFMVNGGDTIGVEYFLEVSSFAAAPAELWGATDFLNTGHFGVSTNDPGASLDFIPAPEPGSVMLCLLAPGMLLRRKR